MSFFDLIGKPWAAPCNPPESYDCWELAVEVRKRLGIATKEYAVPRQSRTAAHRRDLAAPDVRYWKKLERPHDGALVGFGRSLIRHCGVYLNGQVIHAASGMGVVAHTAYVAQNHFGPLSYWEMRNAND